MKQLIRQNVQALKYILIFYLLFFISSHLIQPKIRKIHFDYQLNIPSFRHLKQNVLYSIIVSTRNRKRCFQHVFENLIKCRPNSTEIVVVDDCSTDLDKIEYLRQIQDYHLVTVIQHDRAYGAFHSKVDGFKSAKGKFLMSSDDDDDFDCEYYQEIVDHIKPNADLIVPLNNFLREFFDIHKFYSIDRYIASFHNHYALAFRKELIDNVEYPPKNVTIIRDDAPIMIPLYFQTNFSKVIRYENKYRYKRGNFCPIHHESSRINSHINSVRNGLIYLKRMVKVFKKEEYDPYVDEAYRGFLPSVNITGFDYVYTV